MSEKLIERTDAITIINSVTNQILKKTNEIDANKLTDNANDMVNKFLNTNATNLNKLIKKINFSKTLSEYDDNTLQQLLKKCFYISNSLNLTDFAEYDSFITTDYSTEVYSEKRYMQNTAQDKESIRWVMQNSTWGDFWTTAKKEQIEKLDNELKALLKELNYSDTNINNFFSNESNIKDKTINLKTLINIDYNKNNETINKYKKEIKYIDEKYSTLLNSNTKIGYRPEIYNIGNQKISFQKEIEQLEKKNVLNEKVLSMLHDKVSQSGCKIVATSQIYSELLDDGTFDPTKVIPYVNKEGNLDSSVIAKDYPNIKVKTINYDEIFNYSFKPNSFYLAKADVLGNVGTHWVTIKKISSKFNTKNRKQIMIYDAIYSSSNDKDRYFTSEYLNNPDFKNTSDTKKAKVLLLVEYTKE